MSLEPPPRKKQKHDKEFKEEIVEDQLKRLERNPALAREKIWGRVPNSNATYFERVNALPLYFGVVNGATLDQVRRLYDLYPEGLSEWLFTKLCCQRHDDTVPYHVLEFLAQKDPSMVTLNSLWTLVDRQSVSLEYPLAKALNTFLDACPDLLKKDKIDLRMHGFALTLLGIALKAIPRADVLDVLVTRLVAAKMYQSLSFLSSGRFGLERNFFVVRPSHATSLSPLLKSLTEFSMGVHMEYAEGCSNILDCLTSSKTLESVTLKIGAMDPDNEHAQQFGTSLASFIGGHQSLKHIRLHAWYTEWDHNFLVSALHGVRHSLPPNLESVEIHYPSGSSQKAQAFLFDSSLPRKVDIHFDEAIGSWNKLLPQATESAKNASRRLKHLSFQVPRASTQWLSGLFFNIGRSMSNLESLEFHVNRQEIIPPSPTVTTAIVALLERNLVKSLVVPEVPVDDMIPICEALKRNTSLQRLEVRFAPKSAAPLKLFENVLSTHNNTLQRAVITLLCAPHSYCITMDKIDYWLELNLFGRKKTQNPLIRRRDLVSLLGTVAETENKSLENKVGLMYGLLKESAINWTSTTAE